MKHTRKLPMWYNPVEKSARSLMREPGLASLAAGREGRALLETYCRMYRIKL